MSLLKREWVSVNPDPFTVMSFNVLAESHANAFCKVVNPEYLTPEYRTPRILAEIERFSPDVICLQEVERFEVFNEALVKLGYKNGLFRMKRDSSDGCALFYKSSFQLCTAHMFTYADSSQPCIIAKLTRYDKELIVCNTHLKAKSGNEEIREAQMIEMLSKVFVRKEPGDEVIIAGDFNDVPGSGAYNRLLEQGYHDTGFYPYTTCKEREGRVERISDYLFHSSWLSPVAHVDVPREARPLPSAEYPSDHLAVIVRFEYRRTF